MTFNLINDKWIPVRRLDGTREIITPWQVTDNIGSNPIVSLDANRPDFNGALIQFLIGLVQTTMAPKKDRNWRNGFNKPPEADELKTAFANVSHAFNFDGDSPRFMQDFKLKEGVDSQIDKLLVEMPGESTIEDNKDHFLKRETVTKMCLPCCAMSLFTLQTNAPGGGRGHMTSLRGGGPLTTIIMGDTLWQTIWINTLNESVFLDNCGNPSKNSDADIFPWMGPTRTSEKKKKTYPEHMHPAHMFWGMPRRIVINFEIQDNGVCDLCDSITNNLATSYFYKTHGIKYGEGWRHTLTPYNKTKKNELTPRHGEPSGITFRHWLGLVQKDTESGNEPALVVHSFRKRQFDLKNEYDFFRNSARLWAFGYDFVPGQMKARCWYEGKMPLIHVDENIREDYEYAIEQLIKTSDIVLKNTIINIKNALFDKEKGKNKEKKKKFDFSLIDNRFWTNAETDFYTTLDKLHEGMMNSRDTTEIKRQWLNILFRIGEQLFDYYSQSDQISEGNPKRIAIARNDLMKFNSVNNKQIRTLLDLPINNQSNS